MNLEESLKIFNEYEPMRYNINCKENWKICFDRFSLLETTGYISIYTILQTI